MTMLGASDSRIIYIGNWEEKEGKMVAATDFCKAVLMLRGSKISFSKNGDTLASLDGGADLDASSFDTTDGIHTLFITALRGAVIEGFFADEIIDVEKHLYEKILLEYEEIEKGREGIDASAFKRVKRRAVMPNKDAKIGGVLGDVFNRSVERTKRCYTLPHFLMANNTSGDKVITGWSDWLTGSNYGRMLAGAAKAYGFTRDKELLLIINDLVDRIEKNMREDGYYNYYPEDKSYAVDFVPGGENPRAIVANTERKNYDRTFWTWGLTEAARVGNKKALGLARRMYTWLSESGYAKHLLLGLNSTNAVMGSLLLADSKAGTVEDVLFNKKYLDQKCVEELFSAKSPLAFSNYPGNRPHCYVLLILLSLSYEYRLTGERHYLDALLGAWEIYRRYYKHVGGATAICESGGPYPPGSYYITRGHNGETCGSVFWAWINEELSTLFPNDARFSAEIEEMLFNIAPCMLSGYNVRYHNRMAGKKDSGGSIGTCCEIMATHLSSELPKFVCSYNRRTVYVNQFISGEFKLGGISVRTEADILDKGKFTVTVTRATVCERTLKIRIPEWAKNIKIRMGGKIIRNAVSDGYLTFKGVWHAGDCVSVSFTPEYKAVRYTGAEQMPDNAPRYALLVGPYLMGLVGDFEGVPRLDVSPSDIKPRRCGKSTVIPVGCGMKFIPYFEIKNSENFSVFPAFKE